MISLSKLDLGQNTVWITYPSEKKKKQKKNAICFTCFEEFPCNRLEVCRLLGRHNLSPAAPLRDTLGTWG